MKRFNKKDLAAAVLAGIAGAAGIAGTAEACDVTNKEYRIPKTLGQTVAFQAHRIEEGNKLPGNNTNPYIPIVATTINGQTRLEGFCKEQEYEINFTLEKNGKKTHYVANIRP